MNLNSSFTFHVKMQEQTYAYSADPIDIRIIPTNSLLCFLCTFLCLIMVQPLTLVYLKGFFYNVFVEYKTFLTPSLKLFTNQTTPISIPVRDNLNDGA